MIWTFEEMLLPSLLDRTDASSHREYRDLHELIDEIPSDPDGSGKMESE